MRRDSYGVHSRVFALASAALLILLMAGPTSAWAWESASSATTAATAATAVSSGMTTTQPTDCSSCHGADVVESHHDVSDPNSDFSKGNCSACHSGITTGRDCSTSTCHPSTGFQNKHHVASNQVPIDCSRCHTGAADPQNCSSCHQGEQPRNFHHTQLTNAIYYVNGKLNCAGCHVGAAPVNDCKTCHNEGKFTYRASHHNYVSPTSGKPSCGSCHAQLNPLPDCQSCHAPGSKRTAHHDAARVAGTLCSSCHTGSPQVGNCASCHQGETVTLHHDISDPTSDYSERNCSACHASTIPLNNGCRNCHLFGSARKDKHHTLPWPNAYGIGCNSCHANPGGPYSVNVDKCISCHKVTVKTANIEQKHHARDPGPLSASGGNCGACHAGESTAGSDCATCHLGSGKPPIAQKHHASAQGSDCAACHGLTSLSQSCAGCHTAKAPIAVTHHQTMPAQMDQCSACHNGITQGSLDCAACHVAAGKPPIITRHHQSAPDSLYMKNLCTSCHANTSPAAINCAGCHPSTSPDFKNLVRHHGKTVIVNNTVQPKPCSDCHSGVELLGGSCQGCHTAPIPQIHHADPLTGVGGNCAACHQAVSDPSVCASCHASSPHHATTWSLTGDCSHCHAVPAWAADRPEQAACRECHGTKMHNKGGPIKNYGACAACHNQTPFHPAPKSIPGYTGSGAGKGKFNMFWSQYAREEGPGERLRPNGEDMNDEGGRRIKEQQLSFSTKQISSNGKTYTVPYFTGMAGGNLALNKTATASRAESGCAPMFAVDGDVNTRWWAKSTSTQTLAVDLGSTKRIDNVKVRWHSYHATEYEVRVSTDNRNWTRVVDANYGRGGLETWTFSSRDARYVQIYCQKASSSNGFAVLELEVYAP